MLANGGQLVERESQRVDDERCLIYVDVSRVQSLNGQAVEKEENDEVGIVEDGAILRDLETIMVEERGFMGVVDLNGSLLVGVLDECMGVERGVDNLARPDALCLSAALRGWE